MLPALFRRDAVVPIEVTHPGIGIPRRRPSTQLRAELAHGPFLASFDAGLDQVCDLAPKDAAHVLLVRFEVL